MYNRRTDRSRPTGVPTDITGAATLVRALEQEGVDTVFGLVGHGNLAFVDALQDSEAIEYVSVFHEQVAAHAADAYFRASGRIGVITTTVGPGFTNLMTGLGDALLDSSAMVVIAGGMPSAYVGKEPLQELSYSIDNAQLDIARPLTKRVILASGAAELANQLHRAVRYALSGCPGPVVLQVPLDFFSAWVAPSSTTRRPARLGRSGPDSTEVARAADLIARSERPLLFAGGGAVISGASDILTHLADEFGLPVATTMSGQGAIAEDHPLAIGYTGVVGTRPGNHAAKRAGPPGGGRYPLPGDGLQQLADGVLHAHPAQPAGPCRHRSEPDRQDIPHRRCIGGGCPPLPRGTGGGPQRSPRRER